jgi:hypothetical protein
MERREFLKLSSLFAIGAVIGSGALKSMGSLSSFLSPTYIYKVRHRIGFWIVFSTDSTDLEAKKDFFKYLEDEFFYSGSLEMVEVVEHSIAESKVSELKISLNNTEEVQERINSNINIKNLNHDPKYNSSLVDDLNENFLYDWWVLSFDENERNSMIREYRSQCVSFGLISISITGDADNGDKIKIPLSFTRSEEDQEERKKDKEFYRDVEGFLSRLGSFFKGRPFWKIEERILLKRKRIIEENPNFFTYMDFHYLYQDFIQYYYKRREESHIFMERSKEFCLKQISISDYTISEMRETGFIESKGEYSSFYLEHTGFIQLCIILEKEKNYREVLPLIQNARRGGWSGGFTDSNWEKREIRVTKKIKNYKIEI